MLTRKVEFIKILNLSRPGVRRSFVFVELLHLANYQIHRTSEFIEISNSSKSRIHGNLKFIEFLTGSRSSPSRSSKPHKPLRGARLFKMADSTEYQAKLRHSLLDLARRLQCGGNADTVDFAIFRLQQINRHLVQSDRFNEVVHCISAVTVLLESVEEFGTNHGPHACNLCRAVSQEDRNSIFHKSSFHI